MSEMEYIDAAKKYANRPNLLRVAAELTKCRNPDKALRAMLLAIEGGVDDLADSKKNPGLPRRNVQNPSSATDVIFSFGLAKGYRAAKAEVRRA